MPAIRSDRCSRANAGFIAVRITRREFRVRSVTAEAIGLRTAFLMRGPQGTWTSGAGVDAARLSGSDAEPNIARSDYAGSTIVIRMGQAYACFGCGRHRRHRS